MGEENRSIKARLQARNVSRREFLRFCTVMGATLALAPGMVPKIAEALESKERLPVIWLHFQECTGDDESFLRTSDPTVADLLLDVISLEYNEVLMADAGAQAEQKLEEAIKRYAGRYVTIVEGSIPSGENAYYCTIAGRTAEQILQEVSSQTAAIVAVGACAAWGGWPSARPNPTGAKGVYQLVKDKPIVNLTGCPHNGVNLAATIVHYLVFGRLPALDSYGRPLFAHGKRIHDNCERRAHFDAGQFVEAWGDEGHRKGWCLYKMGCKGPQAYYNCPVVRWNGGTSWPVQAGHGCIACAAFDFWDAMTPFYGRLPEVPGFPVEVTVDRLGVALSAVALAGVAAHAIATVGWKRATRGREEQKEQDQEAHAAGASLEGAAGLEQGGEVGDAQGAQEAPSASEREKPISNGDVEQSG